MAVAAAPPAPPLISLHAAGMNFGHTVALSGIDLTLRRGQRLALIGPNGSGKTTLLRLLHGVLESSSGERSVSTLQPEGRAPRMAMLFQRPFLLNLSVRRNLLLALWLAGVPSAERRARTDQALRRIGLADLALRPATTLSGGQQQRLALARAWSLQPDILLLDEPTASLDPGAKAEVEQAIEDLGRDGITVVMSTHNLGQAKRLATHVACLVDGRLAALAATDDFFSQALPPAAAAFIRGENPWI
ncbi:MAG: ATP-binding cassette domain-containing protein [Rubrivivax sp.]|nr:ATP-binding cassette domain-containing protein [Rubrivivax sp.]MBK8529620.1 ATP-binding cassette domain-containing protein [Rubrivivax sp.]